MVPYGGTYHELFLPGGGPHDYRSPIEFSLQLGSSNGARRRGHGKSNVSRLGRLTIGGGYHQISGRDGSRGRICCGRSPYCSEKALFWSRMAGRITNFSFLGGVPYYNNTHSQRSLEGFVPIGARRRDHGKSNVFPTRATYHWGRVPSDFWPGWLPAENLLRT